MEISPYITGFYFTAVANEIYDSEDENTIDKLKRRIIS